MITYGEGQRYVVSEVTGWEIVGHGDRGNNALTIAVLDSHDCYREVARVGHRTAAGNGRGRVKQSRLGRKLCDRLNAEHSRAALLTARPEEFDYDAELAALQQRRLDLIRWWRYRDHRSTSEIASRLGITVQYVNQLLRESES
jgi:DNA-binding CsgD family transcriptional regulator